MTKMRPTKRRQKLTTHTPALSMADFYRQMLTGQRAPIAAPSLADYQNAANL